MWTGGVRLIISDEAGRILLVRQHHEGRDIWLPPGGSIEAGEDAARAAAREALEETGLVVALGPLIWHVEEVGPGKEQRFVNFFLAEAVGGVAALGTDPEFDAAHQVLRELRFFSRVELDAIESLYPPELREEVWRVMAAGGPVGDVFRIRNA
jgi:ADP-ribose pyrophosphatase YjhB (NUDIX family)